MERQHGILEEKCNLLYNLFLVRRNEENFRLQLGERTARLRERHEELERHVTSFKEERETMEG